MQAAPFSPYKGFSTSHMAVMVTLIVVSVREYCPHVRSASFHPNGGQIPVLRCQKPGAQRPRPSRCRRRWCSFRPVPARFLGSLLLRRGRSVRRRRRWWHGRDPAALPPGEAGGGGYFYHSGIPQTGIGRRQWFSGGTGDSGFDFSVHPAAKAVHCPSPPSATGTATASHSGYCSCTARRRVLPACCEVRVPLKRNRGSEYIFSMPSPSFAN